MSDSKVFMIPDAVSGHTNTALDPNLLITQIMNNGGFGNNGNWIWIIFLFLLFGRNGFGNYGDNVLGTGYLSNQINNTSGRDLLMQAINGNGTALQNLSNMLNSDINSINEEVVVVDPPRGGLDKTTTELLCDSNVKRIVYVSCNPITLARDLKVLKEKYDLDQMTLFDMFPNTKHVECVCLL